MTSYLSGKTGVITSPVVSVKKVGFGSRLGNCPDACPPGYSHDPVTNVCILNSVAPVGPVLPVVMAGKKFGRAW
jgi:hypothetical protein